MDWKLTATKLYCEPVGQWVTVLVYRDGTVKCSYCEREKVVAGRRGRNGCVGYEKCSILAAYKDDVFQREQQVGL